MWDNDYYFYEDGTILHSYDKNINNYNIEESIIAEKIPLEERQKMLEACPQEYYNQIKEMLKL